MPEKTTPQTIQIQQPVTVKHHFITAAITAGIILVIALFIWIPFKLIPAIFSSGSSYVATTLSSTFVPATSTAANSQQNTNPAASQAQTNQSGSNTYSANTAHTTYNSSAVATNYSGLPDLAITLIGTGVIDSSGQFVQTPYAGINDTIGIKFAVKNVGTNVSGPWTLRLTMPSQTTPNYDSGYQQSIRPGDTMVFTASYNSPVSQGVNIGYITADPMNLIIESNKTNNSITVPFNITGASYNTGYYNTNYNYSTNYGTTYTWVNINANCYASVQSTYPGNPVTWYVTASGGNGYFSYNWNGSDGLTATNNAVTHTYFTSGTKLANVTITSNGQSVTKQCSVLVY